MKYHEVSRNQFHIFPKVPPGYEAEISNKHIPLSKIYFLHYGKGAVRSSVDPHQHMLPISQKMKLEVSVNGAEIPDGVGKRLISELSLKIDEDIVNLCRDFQAQKDHLNYQSTLS